jgi:predicted  nucleic acid-binding Zn-ribbon protein
MSEKKSSISEYMSGLSSILEDQIQDVRVASTKALSDIQAVVDGIKSEAAAKLESIGHDLSGKFEKLRMEILGSVAGLEKEVNTLHELISSNCKDTELIQARVKRIEERLSAVSKLLGGN